MYISQKSIKYGLVRKFGVACGRSHICLRLCQLKQLLQQVDMFVKHKHVYQRTPLLDSPCVRCEIREQRNTTVVYEICASSCSCCLPVQNNTGDLLPAISIKILNNLRHLLYTVTQCNYIKQAHIKQF